MQILKIDFPITNNFLHNQPVVLALGFFDGVHLGHQELIKEAKNAAEKAKLPLMVMTFSEHPRVYFAKQNEFKYLTTITEKADILAKLGVDYLAVFDFDHGLGELDPKSFVEQVIIRLNAKIVVAGFDYTYGPASIANMANLPKFAAGKFKIIEVPEQIIAGVKIGSTTIRSFIETGNVAEANKMLGYPYQISGKVIYGKQRGRQMGFRTANLEYPTDKVLPAIGVYATKLKVNGKWYEAMTSVGHNVTFESDRKLFIETNIFNFDENIYDKTITIAWYEYLRGEIKFNSPEELMNQLQNDKKETKAYFSRL